MIKAALREDLRSKARPEYAAHFDIYHEQCLEYAGPPIYIDRRTNFVDGSLDFQRTGLDLALEYSRTKVIYCTYHRTRPDDRWLRARKALLIIKALSSRDILPSCPSPPKSQKVAKKSGRIRSRKILTYSSFPLQYAQYTRHRQIVCETSIADAIRGFFDPHTCFGPHKRAGAGHEPR